MIAGSIARRYAKALFELAVEKGQEEALQELLSSLAEAVRSSRELRDVFENPAYGRDQRAEMVEALAKHLKAPPLLRSFLHLLVDRNRLHYLEGIARYYGSLADAHAGRLRAQVVSAVELKPATATHLSKSLEAATGRRVVLEQKVEASLLGGVVAHVGGRVFDGSLEAQLEDLRRQLKTN